MNYEHVRESVKKAIAIVDHRLKVDVTGEKEESSSCQLDSLTFDQTFCEEDDVHDETMVSVGFSWWDPQVKATDGAKAEVLLFEEDFVSSHFIAGIIYAKITSYEGLL